MNGNNNEGGMFDNTGDSTQVDRSTEGGVGGTFSNTTSSDTTSAPARAPINPNNNTAGTFDNDSNAPSAGYDNNVESNIDEGEGKKRGFMSKVKDAFVPKPGGIGREGLVSFFLSFLSDLFGR
ncbi:hypothetical protein NA56DRAFT_177155 [Hyaloscypha hepaticicola]|uniref:Uncharacterized protein n=1 Tax=Hyaloscypha hepaticicola TaxID=2082293 RepID=A0A2J6Q1Z8_9HELO|nr:hypothetical protein NA56DRAFT_177155 [Hyaloscypha hepaticicola]